MKAIIKIGGGLFVTAIVTLGLLYVVAGDRFMPWIPQEDVYVATSLASGYHRDEGGYDYTAPYISKTGKKGMIEFYAPRELRKGAYIKLDAKGNYVASWEEVQKEELPAVVSQNIE